MFDRDKILQLKIHSSSVAVFGQTFQCTFLHEPNRIFIIAPELRILSGK
jgi:hypothetical protein